jgi:tryptophan synthase alpha chain
MSTRIAAAFAKAKREKRAAFIPFIMGGDPNLDACAKLLAALPEAGADIIELGIPFSDPMADGKTIQAAGLRALQAGATLAKILTLAADFRKHHKEMPLVLMGYFNPVYHYGVEKFAADAAKAGVDGIILVDLPPEEAAEVEPHLTRAGIALIRLIAPTSIPTRLKLLTQHASGYLYYISVTGITGAGSATTEDIAKNITAIRAVTDLPVAVGFGVKTAAQVREIGKLADGVVVGSAIVAQIAEHKGAIAPVMQFVNSLRG